jgi:tripeptidyl-peptidase-1
VPVSLAEELLDTEYHVFQHASGESIVRTTAYRLPAHVHAHVDVVQPTTTFGLFRPMTATSHFADESSALVSAASSVLASTGATVNASCNSMITPQCLYDLYSVNHNGTTGNGNSIGTTGYLEKYFNSTDLNNFYRAFVPEAVGQNVTVFSVNGGINNQSAPSGEAELDTQYAFGIGYPAKATFYTTAGRPPVDYGNNTASNSNEPYQDWLDFVLKQGKDELPLVISTSYGDIEETVPYSYAKRVCAGMAQLGARGVTGESASGTYCLRD